jgi:nicotinamidase-related amidase
MERAMNTAVLVIDVQQALCVGEQAAYDAAGVIHRINAVTRLARKGGAPVVFVQHEGAGTELAHGSVGWQLAPGLQVEAGDLRVPKTTADAFLRTNLQELLQARHVGRLIVCGMHSEFCVDTTVRRSLALGYPVTLVADAHTSAGNSVLSAPQVIAHHNVTLAGISSFGPRVTPVTAAELVLDELSPRASA